MPLNHTVIFCKIVATILLYHYTQLDVMRSTMNTWGCLYMGLCALVYFIYLCVCECAWCLSGSLCRIWLMVLVVETALPWLQLQAALVFSLTYDNAPVTLIRKPRSTFVADGCSRFFFFALFLFFFVGARLPCPLHPSPSVSLLSLRFYSALAYIDTHKKSKFCHLERFADYGPNPDHSRWRLLHVPPPPPAPPLNAAAATVLNSSCVHWPTGTSVDMGSTVPGYICVCGGLSEMANSGRYHAARGPPRWLICWLRQMRALLLVSGSFHANVSAFFLLFFNSVYFTGPIIP